MTAIASFHLVREPGYRAPIALARLGGDRLRLPRTPGLRFARVLGTGHGSSTAPGAQPARSALFAVWDCAADLVAFEQGWFGRRLARVRRRGGETYRVQLHLLSGHGSWGGHAVVDDLDTGQGAGHGDGPMAVLTRARIRTRTRRRFRAAARDVSHDVCRAPGLLAVAGIGELPTGTLGTFSLWSDAHAATRFAYQAAAHPAVVRQARAERWYAEELFVRFAPTASSGTWDGRDPLRT